MEGSGMDATRFDAVVRRLGRGTNRREALTLLAGAAALGVGETVAKRRRREAKGKARAQAEGGSNFDDKFDVEEVDDEFVNEFLTDECGFEVLHTVVGTIKSSVDKNGLFLFRFRLKQELIGPGGTLSYPDVGVNRDVAVVEDGDNTVVTVQATGVLALRIVVPGQGVVAANTGREIFLITFNTETGEFVDFEVIVDRGLDRPLEGAALEAVCAALA
jgi:hypothetical protein